MPAEPCTTKLSEVDEVDEAALRTLEAEARREADEIIAAVQAQAARALERTAETQASVDEIM